MKKTLITLSLLTATAVMAATPADIESAMKKDYPNINVIGVIPTPIPNIFEVDVDNAGRKMAMYTDSTATYFFTGMVDGRKQISLSEDRNNALNKVNFADLPFKNAIKTVKGDGSRKMAVFADPNCGYCKKMEGEFDKLSNVTIYTFLVGILGDSSKEKAESIWCSSNRSKALRAALVGGEPAPQKSCSNPLEENLTLFKRLGFQGTPSVVFQNGKALPGYAPVQEINRLLDSE